MRYHKHKNFYMHHDMSLCNNQCMLYYSHHNSHHYSHHYSHLYMPLYIPGIHLYK